MTTSLVVAAVAAQEWEVESEGRKRRRPADGLSSGGCDGN